jgi:arabinofuranosyltransferase
MWTAGTVGRRRVVWGGVAVGLSVLAWIVLARGQQRWADDAYIFFRYAEHLVGGDGWSYNPGQATTNGATSPLWTLLLAAATPLGDIERSATLLYAGCLGGAATLTAMALRRSGESVAAVVAALLIVSNPTLLRIRGMESALFLLLCAAVVVAGLHGRRQVVTGVLGGLLVLVRPEGIVLLAAVLVRNRLRERSSPWPAAAVAAAVVAPWAVVSMIEFGSPVAGTLAAKAAQGRSGFFGPPFVFARAIGTMVVQPWALATLVLAAVGLWFGMRRPGARDLTAVVVTFAGVQYLTYALVVRPPAYLWYLAPTYWVLAILAGLAAGAAGRGARHLVGDRVGSRGAAAARVLGAAAVCVPVVLLSLGGQRRGDLYLGYREAAEWLDDNTPSGASVAATEIGVLGWASGRPVVDYLGLLDEQSVQEVGRGDLASWLDREQPDYYVQHLPVWDLEVPSASRDWFARAYRPVFESTEDGWSRVRVFERVRTREQALAAQDPVVLTPVVLDAFTAAGVPLDPAEREALAGMLAVYVGDLALQEQFETDDGVDLAGLLGETASVRALSDAQVAALERVSDRLGSAALVTPLA